MREVIRQLFPRLRDDQAEITSPPDFRYNCVAWAAGDVSRWWWPTEPTVAYWPDGVAREETVWHFIEAFATLGYEAAATGNHEPEIEKVAIFASKEIPTHMARQLPNGSWTSKLGSLEDISHHDINSLSGSDYGEVAVFLQRRKTSVE
jgi:hypothetical protein